MAVRRSAGKREYPAAAYLAAWALRPSVWPYFDGWCAARNVDHEALPWSRWLNLVYFFAVRNASAEDIKKFDNAIADHVAAWNLARAKPAIEQVIRAPRPTPKPGQRERRLPPRPAGWGDATRATFDNKAAIKTLTAGGVSGRSRRK